MPAPGAATPRRDPLPPRVRLVALVLAAIFVGSLARNLGERGDFQGYLEVGELVLRGADIYADARPGVSTWPPFFAVVCVPLALLARVSVVLARGLWLVVNGVIVYALLRLVVELVYRRRLALDARAGGVSLASAAVLGPLVLSSRFILGNLDRLQINMFILWCCLAGGLMLTRGRPGRGGALIGLAAALKVLPVFFVPYLVWKRWWRALAAAAATGAACTALPIVVFGPARWWAYLRHWMTIAGSGWPVRKGNQSVYAMVDRFYTHGTDLRTPDVHRLVASNDPVVAALVYGLLALVAWLLVRAGRRGGRDPASPAVVVELAIVLAVAVLFSPLAWKHYFVFLLLGHAVLWRAIFADEEPPRPPAPPRPAGESRARPPDPARAAAATFPALPPAARQRLAWMLGASFVLTTLTVRGLVGKSYGVAFEAMSAVTFGAVLVLAALLELRRLLGRYARAE